VLSKVVAAIPCLGTALGGRMATAPHFTTLPHPLVLQCRIHWHSICWTWCHGTADFKTLMEMEFIFVILSTVQRI